jgi:hypothetical protein
MNGAVMTVFPTKKTPRRLILRGDFEENWYIASSTHESYCAEGTWQDWVALARTILAEDRERQAFR